MKKKRYEQYIFTVIFLVAVFAFAGLSMYQAKDELIDIVKNAEVEQPEDLENLIESLDDAVDENTYERYNLIEAYGAITLALGKNEVNGFQYVRDKNGYLNSGNFWAGVHDRDIKSLALDVEHLYEQLQADGTDMLVMSFPQKYSAEWTEEYAGIPYDDFSYNMNQFMIQIRKYRIPNVDCQSLLEDSDLEYEDMFFKTDHHWKSEAAFLCFQALTDEIEELGYDVDSDGYYRDLSNYTIEEYEDMMLGSEGRSTGILYTSGVEDFELYYLDDGSVYDYYALTSNGEKHYNGTITESLISYDIPELIQNDSDYLYTLSMYDMYMRGVQNEVNIVNESNPDGLKVLMLRDSYADPVATYMAPYCSQLDMLWTKYVSEERIQEYIVENDYDLVIVALYPDDISSDFIHFCSEE